MLAGLVSNDQQMLRLLKTKSLKFGNLFLAELILKSGIIIFLD